MLAAVIHRRCHLRHRKCDFSASSWRVHSVSLKDRGELKKRGQDGGVEGQGGGGWGVGEKGQ